LGLQAESFVKRTRDTRTTVTIRPNICETRKIFTNWLAKMKDLFPGYYPLSKDEFDELWKNCVFILDTNSILNLYRYNDETRTDFIDVLRKIENRLWIPHQVALEFQENRTGVIDDQENKLKTIKEILNQGESSIKGKLRKFSVKHEDFLLKLNKLFNEFLEEIELLENQKIKLGEQDYIRDIVDDLFNNKIGEPPTEKELTAIYEEGEKRYLIKYPPGFHDLSNKKKENPYRFNKMSFKREYGDLILWKEIIKEVKPRNWKHIIFITDDKKEDWWREEKGENIGARPELVEEIRKAGVSIFYMYTPERFLKYAKKYIKIDIKEESINQVKIISESNHKVGEVSLPDSLQRLTNDLIRLLSTIKKDGFSNLKHEIAKYNSLRNIEGLEDLVVAASGDNSLKNTSTLVNFAKHIAFHITISQKMQSANARYD
jgi:hypothetical protein